MNSQTQGFLTERLAAYIDEHIGYETVVTREFKPILDAVEFTIITKIVHPNTKELFKVRFDTSIPLWKVENHKIVSIDADDTFVLGLLNEGSDEIFNILAARANQALGYKLMFYTPDDKENRFARLD